MTGLETQQQRRLGCEPNHGSSIDSELRITNERLVAHVSALTKQMAKLRRINTILQTGPAASRQAHAGDTVVRHSADQSAVDDDDSGRALASDPKRRDGNL